MTHPFAFDLRSRHRLLRVVRKSGLDQSGAFFYSEAEHDGPEPL